MMTEKHREAALQLRGLPMRERLALLASIEHEDLAAAEEAKAHPLRAYRMAAAEWEQFCAHMTDGGGVVDRGELGRSLLERLFQRRQNDGFWADLAHYCKACLKTEGHVQGVPGEAAVIMRGVAPEEAVSHE